ncbi:hypothetical protein [Tolypothrix sp. VBCCA 56010]|uniref:hypothetical protein n=1 Tax=Tolypothrix sp. VBCCA 56010 TaxID=3137731 RepID=UPI003D7F0AB9
MTIYSEQLRPWCIIRTLPNKKQIVVARFRRRDDAVAYLQVLQSLLKDTVLTISFDSQLIRNSPENDTLN